MKKIYGWIIIIGFLLITILIGKNIPKNIVDADVTNYVPQTIDSKINTDYINELFDDGYYIKIFTSRYMGRSKESKTLAKKRGFSQTKSQLRKWGLKYNKLIFGMLSIM